MPSLLANRAGMEKVKRLGWGRDPFLYPRGTGPRQKEYVETRPSWKLTAVLIGGRRSTGTIDQPPYVVSVGDRIEQETVMKLDPDRIVVATDAGERREVFLESGNRAPALTGEGLLRNDLAF